jgi:hypothetical protein
LKTVYTGLGGLYLRPISDGTVIWTSPSGDTYVTTPGSALLFPSQQNQRARESTTTTAGGRVLRELPPRRRRRPAALLLESLLLTATRGIDISEAAVLTKLVLR